LTPAPLSVNLREISHRNMRAARHGKRPE